MSSGPNSSQDYLISRDKRKLLDALRPLRWQRFMPKDSGPPERGKVHQRALALRVHHNEMLALVLLKAHRATLERFPYSSLARCRVCLREYARALSLTGVRSPNLKARS